MMITTDTIEMLRAEAQKLLRRIDRVERLLNGADQIEENALYPTISLIIEETAKVFGVKPIDIRSQRRHQHIALPRHVVMYLSKEMTLASFPVIGRALGRRDHTTALAGRDKIVAMLETDTELRQKVAKIEAAVMSRTLTEYRNAA